jgi:hypothetical protein
VYATTAFHKHLFVSGEHPQTRISIHRCYKLWRAVAQRGVGEGDFGGTGVGLCTILHTNFRELLFHALGCIRARR